MDPALLILPVMFIVAGFFLYKALSPKKCPDCGSAMRILTHDVGKTQKYDCPKCHKRLDTGIPTGRSRRRS